MSRAALFRLSFPRLLACGVLLLALVGAPARAVTPMVAAGSSHSCALLPNGTVLCWGYNASGGLGRGFATPLGGLPTPGPVAGLDNAVAVATGVTFSCATLANGGAKCWGSNESGQLGNGLFVASTSPVAVSGPSGMAAVDTGTRHACALLGTGAVWCWGNNAVGQLGAGTSIANSAKPVAVVGISTAKVLSTGSGHSCAALASGAVQCWGYNATGQLGNGTVANSLVPVSVAGLTGATAVSAGISHSCALLASGTVQCWGANSHGQLGDGTITSSSVPVTVKGISDAVAVKAGGSHSCAVLRNGTAKCWGDNTMGQLGVGGFNDANLPAAVNALSGVVSLAAGRDHSCAITAVGDVSCWGGNYVGQLGNGTLANAYTAAPIATLAGAQAVAVGVTHGCALLGSGTVQCWGRNAHGEAGGANITDLTTPTTISGISTATAVSVGQSHSCALLANRTVQCWGENALQQRGDLLAADSATSRTMPAISDAVALASGDLHSCVVVKDGTVRCWGANSYGQLGNGNTAGIPLGTATTVSGISTAVAVGAGGATSCAVLANGSVQCWGYGGAGLLGNGVATVGGGQPVVVSAVSNAVKVAVGKLHACAVLATGGVRCWGSNTYGALGNQVSGVATSGVVTVVGISNAVAVSAGYDQTCALLATGDVRCWGTNAYGQLGTGTPSDSSVAQAVTGVTAGSARGVSAADGVSCATLADGSGRCWGSDDFGQRGTGRALTLAPGAVQGVNGQATLNALTSTASDVDKVFAWAERQYPQYFGPAGQASQSVGGYRVRSYGSHSLLVNENGTPRLYYKGPLSGNVQLDLDPLAFWLVAAGR